MSGTGALDTASAFDGVHRAGTRVAITTAGHFRPRRLAKVSGREPLSERRRVLAQGRRQGRTVLRHGRGDSVRWGLTTNASSSAAAPKSMGRRGATAEHDGDDAKRRRGSRRLSFNGAERAAASRQAPKRLPPRLRCPPE